MNKAYLGVDPGLSGGLVVIDRSAQVLDYAVMPRGESGLDVAALAALVRRLKRENFIHMVFLERVHSMPGQGVASTFAFGMAYGQISAVLIANSLPVTLVQPQVWSRYYFSESCPREKRKARSRAKFEELYPGLDLKATDRSKKDHEGLIDALLIARYGLSLVG